MKIFIVLLDVAQTGPLGRAITGIVEATEMPRAQFCVRTRTSDHYLYRASYYYYYYYEVKISDPLPAFVPANPTETEIRGDRIQCTDLCFVIVETYAQAVAGVYRNIPGKFSQR